MSSRLRSLAALLALCALSLSMTGSAWAAMCAGAPAAPPAHVAAAEGGHGAAHGQGHGHGHHGAAPAPAPPGESERSGEDGAPACPLMAPGAAGSCLGTFVGAAPTPRAVPSDPEAHDFPLPRGVRGLLDPSPPFRPPEA
jgi:hypothetical protein